MNVVWNQHKMRCSPATKSTAVETTVVCRLQVALRNSCQYTNRMIDGKDVMPEVNADVSENERFLERVITGFRANGKAIRQNDSMDQIGIGGLDLVLIW
ncbi:hypothetical protein LGIHADK_03086 [Mannheimia haemolytica]